VERLGGGGGKQKPEGLGVEGGWKGKWEAKVCGGSVGAGSGTRARGTAGL
jgi:hypothetical protein